MHGVVRLLIAFILIPTICFAQQSGKGNLAPSTPLEVYQNAQRAIAEGRKAVGFELLEVAANRGVLGAQIEVARMSATGTGAPLDEAKAFHFYRRIANDYADVDRRHSLAQFVAEAFRMSGIYLRDGIPSANIKANPAEASRMMLQAAAIFHDREAQYELAMMYLGDGALEKNPRIAVGWLVNAARKRYAPAQGTLGDMMWRGADVKRSPVEGLALMAVAMDNATEKEALTIGPLYENAVGEVDIETIRKTEEALEKTYRPLRVRPDGPRLEIKSLRTDMVMREQPKGTLTSNPPIPGGIPQPSGQVAPPTSNGNGFGLDNGTIK